MNEKDFKSKFDDVMDAFDYYIVIKNGKEAIFNKNFEMINTNWFEYIFKIGKVYIFCQNNKYGLLDESGKVVVEAQYDDIENLNSNCNELATCKNGKWGMIDDNGNILIDFKYKSIYTNSMYSLVIAQNFDEKFGLITTNNKVILDFIYDDIYLEWDDDFEIQAYVATLNGKHIIYNEKGELFNEVR